MQGSPSPGARRKSGHRGNSGIAYGLLLPVQDGGLGAAERAVAPEGRGLAPRSAGSDAAYVSDWPSPYPTPPGSLRKDQYVSDSGLGSNDSELGSTAVTVRAGAAGDCRHLLASRTGTFTCTRATRACFLFVAMSHDAMRAVTRL